MKQNGKIPLDATVIVSTEQISCDLKDEVVVLSLTGGVYYGLNTVGSRVWQLLQQPRVVREIRDILLAEYDVDEEQCTRELVELLQELSDCKLLRLHNGKTQA